MIAAYLTAAIPEPYRILGLRLKPFSLGHYLLLRRFGCAFVSDREEQATHEDLIIGVLICSMKFDEFLEFIEDPDSEKELASWGAKAYDCDLLDRIQLFKRYLSEGSKVPQVWFEEEGDASGAHWSQYVLLSLTGNLGYTHEEAINLPLAKAFADFFKHAENLGAVRLMSESEIEQLKEQEVALES